jgi:Sulfotransferase family
MSSEALIGELEVRNQQIRRLLVGDGATFSELEVSRKVGDGTPYGFEELLDLPADAPTPPLIFIHIPRTAGTTVNKILMRNYKYRADSHGANFFPPYFPDQFLSLVQRPHSPDDRIRPAFFTGHIDLTNNIFRYIPVRYVALTVLRDPVDRIVSHYRFNSTQPSIFQDAIRKQGLDLVGYVQHFGAAIAQQYELFAPASIGSADKRATQALRNLEASVSLFGLQERFEEFSSMLAALLGLPDVSHKVLNKLPSGAADVTQEQIEEVRQLLKTDVDFYEGAKKLYSHRQKLMAKHSATTPHPWTRFYA